MNQRSWLTAKNPYRLVEHLGSDASRRKLRLLGVACCRRQPESMKVAKWEWFQSEQLWVQTIDVAEQFADGLVSEEQLQVALDVAFLARQARLRKGSHLLCRNQWDCSDDVVLVCYSPLSFLVTRVFHATGGTTTSRPVLWAQCDLVRDIFGNPFRTIAFSSDWRTDTAVSLARGMYESREFGAMPILADALQDAGCDSADILNHCRDAKQVHIRGCWVVDLVLGKE